ncbi:hypothetical protein ACFFX0_03450 [Citricoccus parietis]|uniref:Uncharacterized protein n=1 Tax=Citricoccus parietis TaxID=592307 RepID=A0ABV5FUD9_9MICC
MLVLQHLMLDAGPFQRAQGGRRRGGRGLLAGHGVSGPSGTAGGNSACYRFSPPAGLRCCA